MKKFMPFLAATLLVATLGVGTAAATGAPVRTPVVNAIVTKVAAQGGRIYVIVQVRHCDRATAANYAVTATPSIGSAVTLKRAGVTMNVNSHSRSCVYRGRISLAANAPVGNMTVTVGVQRLTGVGGSPLGAAWSKVFTTKVLKNPAN